MWIELPPGADITPLRSKAEVRTILLDGDGVVQLSEPSWMEAIQALCGNASKAERFLQDVFEAERPALVGQADFRVGLLNVLKKWEIAVPVDDALRIWHRIRPDPDALNLIAELRSRGLTVGLASNQQTLRAAYMRDVLDYGALFDQLLFSYELGFAKPDQRYFETVLQRLRVQPDESLFIDDHAPNVEAARLCGMHAELFHLREGIDRLRSILIERRLLPDRPAGQQAPNE